MRHSFFPQRGAVRQGAREQVVVPEELRRRLLEEYHEGIGGGHFGRKSMIERLRAKYWWPGFYADIARWVQSCEACQRRKSPRVHAGLLQPMQAEAPWDIVALDLVGPLPLTTTGYKYVACFIDHFSGYPFAFPLKDITAESVAKLYVNEIVLGMPGAPRVLLTDKGAQLNVSDLFKGVNKLLGVEGRTTSAYHPATNGKVERFNRTLKEKLTTMATTTEHLWDEYIPSILAAYRSSPQARTGDTPNFLCFGRDPQLPIDRELLAQPEEASKAREYKWQLIEKVAKAVELAQKNTETEMARQKKHFDKGRRTVEYQAGDLVWLEVPRIERKGQNRKFAAKWRGPYRVITKTNDLLFKIAGVHNRKDVQHVHVQRMKSYTERESEEEDEEGHQEIDYIVDVREGKAGQEFLVKWRGWSNRHNQWVQEGGVKAAKLVKEFWQLRGKEQKEKKKEEEKEKEKEEEEEKEKEKMKEREKEEEKEKEKEKNHVQRSGRRVSARRSSDYVWTVEEGRM